MKKALEKQDSARVGTFCAQNVFFLTRDQFVKFQAMRATPFFLLVFAPEKGLSFRIAEYFHSWLISQRSGGNNCLQQASTKPILFRPVRKPSLIRGPFRTFNLAKQPSV